MAFRLTVLEAADLTTVRIAGRLGDDGVAVLYDACTRARRPLVLDLSELTGGSEAGMRLLRRLADDGVHLLGTSRYVKLLLEPITPPPPRRDARRPAARRRASARRRPTPRS